MTSTDIYTSKEAFVYKWTNITNDRIYIGKHKGTLEDGYISSGKAFLRAYNSDPNNFNREILYYGTSKECLVQEGIFIKQAINSFGYEHLYNLTHWNIVLEWKRTCVACGAWCDPRNDKWADEFELYHFENCNNHWKNIKPPERTKKSELLLCTNNFEKSIVNRYYHFLNTNYKVREINRLRKLIDNTLYKL